MATLEKIRTKAGLLVAIVIGVSLAAFILGDMLQSGNSIFQKQRLQIGEIDGQTIQYPDFQKKVEELGEIYKLNTSQSQITEDTWVQLREQTWQTMIRDVVMGEVYDDLGIAVSSQELYDMIQGSNLHPIIQQLFTNPNTGQVDKNAIVSFLKNLDTGVDPDQKQYWLYIEKQISEDRIQSKYANMVGKGMYITTEEAKESLDARNKQVNIDFILLNHNTIADSQVVVTEKDLKSYYDLHKEDYEQETTRRIEYVTFPVKPSAADFKTAEDWIKDIKADFETTTDNEQFVNANSDVSFDNTWYKKESLPENIGNWIYEEGADTNQVFGPYFENDAYKLAKVNAIEMLPDSVEARHILLQVNSQAELLTAQTLADSLKTAIENGSDFATLARQYSKDQGSAILGGDLGWFSRGQMVKPFEEAAFKNAKNEVTVVATQYGIHIIQTTNRSALSKQVQVAYVVRNVVPSTRTYQDTYSVASKFASENKTKDDFDAAVTEQKLTKKVANVGENDRQITGLDNARQMIRAAYDSEIGDVIVSQEGTPIFELGDNYIIAVLAGKTEKGISPFEDVKARIELSVIKDKKAELLAEKAKTAMAGKTDMETIAAELGTTVQHASALNFNSFQLTGVGLEPAVIGTSSALGTDKISEPIAGNNGVFIVKVVSVNEQNNQDVAGEKLRLAQNLNYRATQEAYTAQKNVAEIVDRRSKFY